MLITRCQYLKIILSIIFFVFFSSVASGANPPWPEASFTYIADNQALSKVLTSFCRTFGIDLQATPAVLSRSEIVNGKISTSSPTEFLNQMGATYGFQWFYLNGSLHISRNSETSTKSISPSGMNLANFRKALTEIGVLEPKFGWGELPDRGSVIISGPPAYVDQVAWAVATLPLPQGDQQIKVFRLKHATVNDRVITYRDQRITTAGIATILRNLITGEPGRTGTSTSSIVSGQLESISAPLRSSSPLEDRTGEKSDSTNSGAALISQTPENTGAFAAGNNRQRPTIQADSRLNALIIKDLPSRMAVYEDLISLLDVPSKLVEIEAIILDINSSRINDLGIDWGGRVGNVSGSFGTPDAPVDAMTGKITFGNNPTTVVANASNFLMTRVRILESTGDARVVSRPTILTVDNLGALIDLSQTFYVQSIGERVANVVPVSVGVTLKVTPHIIENESGQLVQLMVDIEDGSVLEKEIQSLPTIQRSTIGTQAVMAERESLLIGGFNSQTNSKSESNVPGLSSIPFLGAFFKKKSTNVTKRERLFLITPKIISTSTIQVDSVK